jgi:4-amino-4-deoxy-L-arabinose transferase-like glycosyltransferase
LPGAILPPTRFLYIFCGYLWHQLTGTESLASLKIISSIFSMLLLVVSTVFATRAGGERLGLIVGALMAFAPTQIHMSQHALIDGFFAFWAVTCLWLLWENLQHPDHWPRLLAYGIALALLVLTKENALFAYVGLLGAMAVCYWQKSGRVTRFLLAATFLGPLLGVTILVNLCGSLSTFIHIYQLLVSKASVLPYAIATGDGPWYRYLVDLMIMSPVVLILAIGGIFLLRRANGPAWYLLGFMVTSYALMANVRYGMNLRYANMWDMPLCYLAGGCLTTLTEPLGRYARWILPGAVAVVSLLELEQYFAFFVNYNLYELVTSGLLHAIRILK